MDKREIIPIFKAEADDHLTVLDKGLVELEKNSDNPELLDELNRVAHTLKGSARVFGYYEIQEIAHRIEDIFDKVVQKTLKINKFIADTIFKSLDAVRVILDKIIKEEKIDVDVTDVCRELEECIEGRETRDQLVRHSSESDGGRSEVRGQKKEEKIEKSKEKSAKSEESAKEEKTRGQKEEEEVQQEKIEEKQVEKEEELVTAEVEEKKSQPIAAKIETTPSIEQSGADKEIEKQGELEPEPSSASLPSSAEEYVRVPLSRINKLLNLVGEMVINKMKSSTKIAQAKKLPKLTKDIQKKISDLGERIRNEFPDEENEIIKLLSLCDTEIGSLKEESITLYDNVTTEAFHLDPVIDELQLKMKEMRMLPISTIFETFPRMTRDIASELKREINLEIFGKETELDKKVLEGIKPSLIHILRNCIDHGIEEPSAREAVGKPRAGTINLSAFHEGGNVVIKIEDDGKGMDVEQIKQIAIAKNLLPGDELDVMTEKEILNLVFRNGYSTSPIITDVSGRGIGLDVVKRDIDSLKGHLSLETQKGVGTKFTLALPLTIAIIQTLLVKIQNILLAFPMTSAVESLKVSMDDVSTIEGRMAIQVREHTIPLVKLSDVLNLPAGLTKEEKKPTNGRHVISDETLGKKQVKKDEFYVVIASSLDKQVGFIVDEILDEEEVFIKSLGNHLGKVKNVSGASILGTGEVVVIMDTEDLVANSALIHLTTRAEKIKPKGKVTKKRILIAEDALSTRELEKNILESHGYLVDTAVDGLDALNKLPDESYDLVVTDVQMPRMDGFEFCQAIKQSDDYKDIPVIIVTALEKDKDKRRGIEVGAQAYIIKTAFDQSNLLETIERLIG